MDARLMIEEEIKMLKEIVQEKEESQSEHSSVFEGVDVGESELIKDENLKLKELCEKIKEDQKKVLTILESVERDHKLEIDALKVHYIKEMREQEEIIKIMSKTIEQDRIQQENIRSKLAEEKKKSKDLTSKLAEEFRKSKELAEDLGSKLAEETKKSRELAAKHKDLVEKLSDKVECPVCLEVPRSGPVPVCPNGHIVCSKCKKTTCPTCRVAMGNGKSLFASTLLENIEHRCKFHKCEEYFALDKLDDHERDCCHRIVTCPYLDCTEKKIALSSLVSHLASSKTCCYGSRSMSAKKCLAESVEFAYISEEIDMIEKLVFPTCMFSLDSHGLCIVIYKDGSQLYFLCVMFCAEAVCKTYRVEMTVHAGSHLLESEVIFKFIGKPTSIDDDYNEAKHYGLVIDTKAMDRISKKGGDYFHIFVRMRKV